MRIVHSIPISRENLAGIRVSEHRKALQPRGLQGGLEGLGRAGYGRGIRN